MMFGAAVSVLLFFLVLSLVEVHSQTAPYVTFMEETLPNHSYVDLTLVGGADSGNEAVCKTDLSPKAKECHLGKQPRLCFPSTQSSMRNEVRYSWHTKKKFLLVISVSKIIC